MKEDLKGPELIEYLIREGVSGRAINLIRSRGWTLGKVMTITKSEIMSYGGAGERTARDILAFQHAHSADGLREQRFARLREAAETVNFVLDCMEEDDPEGMLPPVLPVVHNGRLLIMERI